MERTIGTVCRYNVDGNTPSTACVAAGCRYDASIKVGLSTGACLCPKSQVECLSDRRCYWYAKSR